jgi:S1-C subfamily serine protease
VEFPGNVRIRARIVASDPAADLALLQLERVPQGVTPVQLGDSDKAEVGDEVFVVGAPFGITHTLTVGHVSARRKSNITSAGMVETELFQTDAAINRGNSGGPMFNMRGEVIGVVSHIVSTSGGSEGLGFVVTSNVARELLFTRPTAWSGVEGYLVRGELARALNVPAPGVGLLVQRVAAGSPAERLGVHGGSVTATIEDEELVLGGDVIVAVQGIAFGSADAYENIRRRLSAVPPGGSIRLAVLRRGEIVELTGAVPR